MSAVSEPNRWVSKEALRVLVPVGIVALGIAVRLVVMLPRLGTPANDPDNYLPLARALANGQGLTWKGRPTAFRPPLYPLVLAPILRFGGSNALPGIFALHLGLATATIVASAWAARLWGLGEPRAWLTALIVACDPVLAVQAASVMTETLAACLIALTLALLAEPRLRRAAVLGGAGFGLATLCRPSLLPAAALTAVGTFLWGAGSVRARLERSILLIGTVFAVLTPWSVRNWFSLGEPVWTTTHGGYTLALANNAGYYDEVLHGPPGAVWSGPGQAEWFEHVHQVYGGLPEPIADRGLRREAFRLIAARPRDFVLASMARLGRFWGLAPSGAVYPAWLRLLTAAWTVPLWLALAVGLARRDAWRPPRLAAGALLLALTAVHALFWTDLRMRAPIVPALALLAVAAIPVWSHPLVALTRQEK
jgi:hypothetical protein